MALLDRLDGLLGRAYVFFNGFYSDSTVGHLDGSVSVSGGTVGRSDGSVCYSDGSASRSEVYLYVRFLTFFPKWNY